MSFSKAVPKLFAHALGVVCCFVIAISAHGQRTDPSIQSSYFRGADTGGVESASQETALNGLPSPPKAFALSMIFPGLGHRYVEGGNWSGWASTFAIADAGLWLSLFGSNWRRDQLIESYTSLAALSANADVEGKGRSFFLNLATYRSSQNYLDTALRNRAWNQIDYVTDPAYQWVWNSEDDFVKYRNLRDDSESLRRRRVVIIASLVANRILSGVMAAWKATRIRTKTMSLQLSPPPRNSTLPIAKLRLRF